MANYQKKIYYVTQAQYDILQSGGTVGGYTGIDLDATYFVRPIPMNYELSWDYNDETLHFLTNGADLGSPLTINQASYAPEAGHAGSATQLATARTLTIGSKGKSFDGTTDVSWTLAEIGAAESGHTHNYAGSATAGGAATSATKLATAITIGGVSFDGSANINLPGVNTAGNQNTSGNAATATKLATARTFTITDYDATNSQESATNFDGSSNFTIKLPSTIKASLIGTASGNLTSSSLLDATKLQGTIPGASLVDASIPVVGIVQTLINNINGRPLTNYITDASHMGEPYPYTLIKYQSTNAITEAEAKTYMKAILGVTWLPQYDYNWPKNIYIIDGSGIVWKPQWTNINNFLGIYELRMYYVTKITTDLTLSTALTNYVPTTRTVNGKALSGNITLSATDVGLGNVTNQSKTTMFTSPVFTGTPWAVTAAKGTNTSQIATTEFVQTAIGDYVAKNTAITGATKTKITYDSKGLVTAGADATLDDIPDGLTRKLNNYGTTTTDVKMNGTQSVGSVDAVARIDHVHPVDTSRAPLSHVHTIGYYSTAGASDLNTTLGTGQFSWSNTSTNTPVAGSYGQGINIISSGTAHNNSNNWITQLAFSTATNTAYFRGKVNGQPWQPWYTLYHTGNKPTATDVGLGNVTNESKTAMFTSPTFTGTPFAVTAAKGTNTTQIATTEFVQTAIGDYVPTTRTVNNQALSNDITLSLDHILDGSTRKWANKADIDGYYPLMGAGTSDKLATAITIGGVSFDGSTNINLPGVNTAGNQNTSGNAATATKLATAKTLTIGAAGKTFNGGADVTWSLADIGLVTTFGSTPTDTSFPSTKLVYDTVIELDNRSIDLTSPLSVNGNTLTLKTKDATTYSVALPNSVSTYAPTTAGSSGQFLISTGENNPIWTSALTLNNDGVRIMGPVGEMTFDGTTLDVISDVDIFQLAPSYLSELRLGWLTETIKIGGVNVGEAINTRVKFLGNIEASASDASVSFAGGVKISKKLLVTGNITTNGNIIASNTTTQTDTIDFINFAPKLSGTPWSYSAPTNRIRKYGNVIMIDFYATVSRGTDIPPIQHPSINIPTEFRPSYTMSRVSSSIDGVLTDITIDNTGKINFPITDLGVNQSRTFRLYLTYIL